MADFHTQQRLGRARTTSQENKMPYVKGVKISDKKIEPEMSKNVQSTLFPSQLLLWLLIEFC